LAGDPLFDAKVPVLGEYIDHHVKEDATRCSEGARWQVAA